MTSRLRGAAALVADVGGVVALCLLVLGTLAGLAGYFLTSPALSLAGLMLACIVLAVGLCRLGVLLFKFTGVEMSHGYRWVSARYGYAFSDDPHFHVQLIRTEIEALRDGVDVLQNQYMWSGWGVDDGPTVVSPMQRIDGGVSRSSGWSVGLLQVWLTSLTTGVSGREGCPRAQEVPQGVQA
jgi:hypothetical protein